MSTDTTMTLTVEPLTLESIGEGQLQEQFEEAMAEVAAAFSPQDPYPYEVTGGIVRAKVTIEIELEHDTERNLTSVDARVKLKRPERKRIRRPVLLRNGVLLTEPSGDQVPMFERKPRLATDDGGAR